MDPRRRLATNLQSESTAYGYTLTVWGAGALLIAEYGSPDPLQVFLYVGGALLGFATLALTAFRRPLSSTDLEDESDMVAISTVHLVATLGNLTFIYVLVRGAGAAALDSTVAFPLVGFVATVTYNVAMLLERGLSERLPSLADSN